MHVELRYDNLVDKVNSTFPGLSTYLADLQTIVENNESAYLTFLSIYVREHWQEAMLQAKLADFINAMEAAVDTALKPVYNDFLLDFYLGCEEQGILLSSFLNQLSQSAKERMLYNCSYWKDANNKMTDGSRY